MLYIGPETKQRITENATGKYPSTAAGFIFGTEDSQGNRTITDVMMIEGTNALMDQVSEKDRDKANDYASLHELLLLGFFQTVTEGPSTADSLQLSDANPNFSYVLLSIQSGSPESFRSFRATSSNMFAEELISDKPLA